MALGWQLVLLQAHYKIKYHSMKKEKPTILKYGIIILVILGIFIHGLYQDRIIKQGNYTIATISPLYSSKQFSYSYFSNNEIQTEAHSFNDLYPVKENERYLIQFTTKSIWTKSNIFFDIRVPDSIKTSPPNGWKELPAWARKK
jgi:hypothetical protein